MQGVEYAGDEYYQGEAQSDGGDNISMHGSDNDLDDTASLDLGHDDEQPTSDVPIGPIYREEEIVDPGEGEEGDEVFVPVNVWAYVHQLCNIKQSATRENTKLIVQLVNILQPSIDLKMKTWSICVLRCPCLASAATYNTYQQQQSQPVGSGEDGRERDRPLLTAASVKAGWHMTPPMVSTMTGGLLTPPAMSTMNGVVQSQPNPGSHGDFDL
ncbi:hypothetical protein BC828DRAFT_407060 [Blastocladiella britannica]|nr:hypothetical protein BC828DRAFT_407060 [Blastocladiella britannica]